MNPRLERAMVPQRITRGEPGFPWRLKERLGRSAPDRLTLLGDPTLLLGPLEAVFCSVGPPPDLVPLAIDVASGLADAGARCVGGFQSPVERLMLEVLLLRRAPVVVCAARAVSRPGSAAWRAAIDEGRLLIVSAVERRRRADAVLAGARNRLVAALAEAASVIHAAAGGRVYGVAREMLEWGVPVRCPKHDANEELLLVGATGWVGDAVRGGARAFR
jgi:predicted Rossmann fold nucleotide-binding protein DprA/Smf involved in DNA uptake